MGAVLKQTRRPWYKRMMRRPHVALPLVVLALLAGLSASAGRSASTARVGCGISALDVYFWPHGHPAVPAYRFPPFTAAHEEVYRKGTTANSGLLAFVSTSAESLTRSCRPVADNILTRWAGGPLKTLKAPRRIRCSFPSKVELRTAPLAGGEQLVVILGHTSKVVVYTEIRRRSSLADYDTRYCSDAPVRGAR